MNIKWLVVVIASIVLSGCSNMKSIEPVDELTVDTTIEDEKNNITDLTYYDMVSDYLQKEAESAFSPYYELLDFKIKNYNETVVGDNIEVLLDYTIIHKNYDKDPDTVGYIKSAKENNSPNYETLYNDYLAPHDMNMEIKAVISKDNEITLYSDSDPTDERDWEKFKMQDCIIKSDDTAGETAS